MVKEARETRDALILQMFLSGITYRAIARHDMVQLSVAGVHKVVSRQMQLSAQRRDFLADNALDVHIERLESIFSANYRKAVTGDAKAGELCRRILDQLGRAHGIDGRGEAPMPPPRDDDGDLEDEADDELGRYRKARESKYG
jgi:hypothetical protein